MDFIPNEQKGINGIQAMEHNDVVENELKNYWLI